MLQTFLRMNAPVETLTNLRLDWSWSMNNNVTNNLNYTLSKLFVVSQTTDIQDLYLVTSTLTWISRKIIFSTGDLQPAPARAATSYPNPRHTTHDLWPLVKLLRKWRVRLWAPASFRHHSPTGKQQMGNWPIRVRALRFLCYNYYS